MNPALCRKNPSATQKHSFTVQETFLIDAKSAHRPVQQTQCRKKTPCHRSQQCPYPLQNIRLYIRNKHRVAETHTFAKNTPSQKHTVAKNTPSHQTLRVSHSLVACPTKTNKNTVAKKSLQKTRRRNKHSLIFRSHNELHDHF